MKTIILAFLSFCFSLGTLAYGGNDFIVKGSLKNVKDGTVLLLMKDDGRMAIEVCSDTVRDGKFSFKWTIINGTEKYSLMPSSEEKGFPSIIGLDVWGKADSEIKITGNNNLYYTWEVKSDIPEQIERNLFVKANEENWNRIQNLFIEEKALSTKNMTKSEKKDLIDSLNMLVQITNKKIALKNIELLKQYPIKTDAGINVLDFTVSILQENNDTTNFPELKHYYNQLTESQKKTTIANNIYTNLYPPKIAKVGEMMVDGELFDLNDNKHYLSEYKGKYILLDFWTFGCGACVKALPKMGELFERQKDKLNIISINMNTPKIWKETSTMIYKITWINLNDKKEYTGLAKKYGLQAMPLYVFISPEGKILFATNYWDQLKKKMSEYINN